MKSTLPRLESGELQSYAWPGGYPIYYLDGFNCVICPDCANKTETEYRLDLLSDLCNWAIDPDDDGTYFDRRDRAREAGVNYEDSSLYCEACNCRIESAYGDDEEEEV
jgi:hypothetical protein